MTKYRKGYLKELREVFDMAEDMCGSVHPDFIMDERGKVRQLRIETFKLLKLAVYPKRTEYFDFKMNQPRKDGPLLNRFNKR